MRWAKAGKAAVVVGLALWALAGVDATTDVDVRDVTTTSISVLEGVFWMMAVGLSYTSSLEMCLATAPGVEFHFSSDLAHAPDLDSHAHAHPLMLFPVRVQSRIPQPKVGTVSEETTQWFPPEAALLLCPVMLEEPKPGTEETRQCVVPHGDGDGDGSLDPALQTALAEYLREVQRVQDANARARGQPDDTWVSEDTLWPSSEEWKHLFPNARLVDERYSLDSFRVRKERPDLFHSRYLLPNALRPKYKMCTKRALGVTFVITFLMLSKLFLRFVWW